MPTEVLKNNIQTTLLSAIDSNDTVITPTDPTGFPATGEQARAAIGDELIIVAGGDGPQFDVTRGAEGTTAVGHAAGEAVRLVLTSDGFSALAELGSALKVTTRRITTAELSTLGDTPVDLVPGVPGALLMGVSVVGQTDPGSVPFGSAPTFTVGGGVSSNVIVDPSLSSSSAQYNSATFGGLGSTTASEVGQPITVVADANPALAGAFLTSSLDSPGSYYAPGDVCVVANDGDDVQNVDQGTKTFTLNSATLPSSTYLAIASSTGNDGIYTIVSGAGTSAVVVAEAIPDATADGIANYGTATLEVDTVTNAYPIVSVTPGVTSVITIAGDHTGDFSITDEAAWWRTSLSAGTAVIASVTLNGGNTDIEVSADLTGLSGGYVGNATVGPNPGGIATYTIANQGTSYVAGNGVTAVNGFNADGAVIIVDTIDPTTPDMEATFTVAYYVVPVA